MTQAERAKINRHNAQAKSVGKYGGLSQSPLQGQTAVWEAFSAIANGIDPDVAWSELMTGYVRDFIQGMWIVKALEPEA